MAAMIDPARPPAPFVVGVARSGTTLLRLQLDSHPELAIPPENYLLLPLLRRSGGLDGLGRSELVELVTSFHTWPDLGLDLVELDDALDQLPVFTTADAIRAIYLLYASKRGKHRWGDKTPTYGRWIAAIAALLPEARFIHLIRDPRAVALSLRSMWFAPATDAAGLAAFWATEIEAIRTAASGVEHYCEIRYEDLIRQTTATLAATCAFLELELDPAMERYHLTAAARLGEVGDHHLPDGRVITREARLAKHHRLSTPPDPSRLDAWRQELTTGEIASIESGAGHLMAELGYT